MSGAPQNAVSKDAIETQTITLVVQRVMLPGDDFKFARRVAMALREYAQDLEDGTAGNGIFERHSCGGCRIDAIASITSRPGQEMREDFASQDGLDHLRARLEDCRQHADYLAGGESATELASTAFGMTPEVASIAIRQQLDEALAALPGDDE